MRLLFCSPDYFDVPETDEDNRHMDPDHPPFLDLAMVQHKRLVALCSTLLGKKQEIIRPGRGLVDMTFTRNGYFRYNNNCAVVARFKPTRRRGESNLYRAHLEALGYAVREMPDNVFFEGGGDAVLYKDKIICGYGMRTSRDALLHLQEIANREVVPVELVRPPGRELAFYHRDTMSIILEEAETVIMYTGATTPESVEGLSKLCTVVPASKKDAEKMALNAIVVPRKNLDAMLRGPWTRINPHPNEEMERLRRAFEIAPGLHGVIVISDTASEELLTLLERLRYYPITLPLTEFLKSGAGPYCLSNDI